jgi:hypothetical protein
MGGDDSKGEKTFFLSKSFMKTAKNLTKQKILFTQK